MAIRRESARQFAELLMAYAAGETLEARSVQDQSWHDIREPFMFGREIGNYRVKPKPPLELEVWARKGDQPVYKHLAYSDDTMRAAGWRLVLMREVLP